MEKFCGSGFVGRMQASISSQLLAFSHWQSCTLKSGGKQPHFTHHKRQGQQNGKYYIRFDRALSKAPPLQLTISMEVAGCQTVSKATTSGIVATRFYGSC